MCIVYTVYAMHENVYIKKTPWKEERNVGRGEMEREKDHTEQKSESVYTDNFSLSLSLYRRNALQKMTLAINAQRVFIFIYVQYTLIFEIGFRFHSLAFAFCLSLSPSLFLSLYYR